MTCRVGHRHSSALRHAEQRKAFQTEIVDDRLEVLKPRVERVVSDVMVGQPAAALVVPYERVSPSQVDEPMAPHGALPVVVEMGDPVRGADNGRARSDRGVGELSAVGGPAEPDLLTQVGGQR